MQRARIWTDASSNRLNFSTGDNNPDLMVHENGHIGLGTSDPTERLEVGNSGNLSLKAQPGSIDSGDIIFKTDTGAEKGRIWTNVNSNQMNIRSNGADICIGNC